MPVNWTKEQTEAIEAYGSNILVAAAAGSGKTAVLVERIIRMITRPQNPVSVDQLLVLTFTEAAATEMRRKIADAVEARLQAEPDNSRLREQSLLVGSANISTIHAFCKRILQNNIHLTNLPADFALADETENEVLRRQALDQVLESYYKRIERKEGFRDLAAGYGGIKSDESLRTLVLDLHDFSRSLAYPEAWLRDAVNCYRQAASTGDLETTLWGRLMLTLAMEQIRDVGDGLQAIWEIVDDQIPSDHKYVSYYQELLTQFRTLFAPALTGTPTLEELRRYTEAFVIGRTPVKKGLEDTVVDHINTIKKECVTGALNTLKQILGFTAPEQVERVVRCVPRAETLKQLVRQTERVHQRLKRERSLLDFSDLEHQMLGLIADRQGRPTPLALSLRERFYEILVDEYQDTNNIQDTMFRLLSRNESNIFMVGDLKQSIYKFRNANPSIFAEKYKQYGNGRGGRLIRLFRNFRSRKCVVDTVNGVFRSIMVQSTGGLDYTEEEFLIPGADYPGEDEAAYASEFLLTCGIGDSYTPDSTFARLSRTELEAITAARRLRAMVDRREILITDRSTGERRPVSFGDITILMRNRTPSRALEQALADAGIPVVSDTGQSYLDSLEVMTVLNFLQVIDNPIQDIPLLAVLRSPMFRFTPEELAAIRTRAEGRYYFALQAAAEQGDAKAANFIHILEDLRSCAGFMGVDELIWKICNDLHYMALAGAMPGGTTRQANLNLLFQRGSDFEQGALSGLFHFMNYISMLRESGRDLTPAGEAGNGQDAVFLMTIHKSKGLEFPVVMVFGTSQKFNDTDASKSIIWHEDGGIGMDYVDTELRIRYRSPGKELIKQLKIQEQHAEEMRLLYVALTRAKEKLIISGSYVGKDNKWMDASFDRNGLLHPGYVRQRSCMRDWLFAAVLRQPASLPLRKLAQREDLMPVPEAFPLRTAVVHHENTPLEPDLPRCETYEPQAPPEQAAPVPAMLGNIGERLWYRYPHLELGSVPVKLSVSELKRRQMPEEDAGSQLIQADTVILTDIAEIGATERGTITHFVMQHLDFSQTDTPLQIEAQLDRMVCAGTLNTTQRSAVDGASIYSFFQSPLGKRLTSAAKVEREFDFYMEIEAAEAVPGLTGTNGKEKVLLQGIADCFFYEPDGVVLIDYKTDRISAKQAPARAKLYQTQMDYYTRGLADILNQPIKERYLYFLHCQTAVPVVSTNNTM